MSLHYRVRILAMSATLIGLTAAGCGDPVAPPIPAESFRLELLSWFEQVWGEPAEGFIELTVVVPSGVASADIDRISSMAVTWPFGAIITEIPAEFGVEESGERAARRRVVRDDGLARGWYTLTVGFDDGQEITIEQPFQGEVLRAPIVEQVLVTEADVTVQWRTSSQHHQWRLSLRRVDAGAESTLDQTSGSGAGSVRWGASFDFSPDPDGSYVVVLEMDAPYNHRELIIPITV